MNAELVPKRRRKLTEQDIEALCRQVARGLTETEACHNQDIDPKHWFVFKQRDKVKQKFDNILSRMKQARIDSLLTEIERAAMGGKTLSGAPVRHDWRAADRLLSVADNRFSQAAMAVNSITVQSAVTVQLGGEDQLRKLIESVYSKRKQVTVESSPAQPALNPPSGVNDKH